MRIRTHTNPFNYYFRMTKPDYSQIFPAYSGSLDFEVGFGRGAFLTHYCQHNPARQVVGIDVRKQVITQLQERWDKLGLTNGYLVHGNALIFLEDCVDPASIDRMFIFHPDPWFKKAHHKRRVVTSEFLKAAASRLKPGAMVYVSTDVEELHLWMMDTFQAFPAFQPTEDPDFWNTYDNPNWTRFARSVNRTIFYSVFRYQP